MKISAAQIAYVYDQLMVHGITSASLRDDLHDHLCSEIELRLAEGIDFDAAWQASLAELAPDGIRAIEEETNYLLHPRITMIKKIAFLSGTLFAVMASSGCILKVLHLPLGTEFITLGFLGLIAVVAPMAIAGWNRTFQGRWPLATGLISATMIGIAVVLKVNHMEGANLSLLIGGIIFSFGFIPSFSWQFYKKAIA
jgi:hypothetical protein